MVPISYSYRSLFVRWKTTLMTAVGFMLVVWALIVMFAFLNGVHAVCAISGEKENVIVLNEGSGDEIFSRLGRSTVSQVETAPGVLHDSQGRPVASREIFMSMNIFDVKSNDLVFFPLRGVTPTAFTVHQSVRLLAGRGFRPSQSEVIVGKAISKSRGMNVGDVINMGRKQWKVTGVFEAGGSTFESEVWCDMDELASQFKREGTCSSVVLRAPNAESAKGIAERIDQNKRYSVEAKTEDKYYEDQAKQTQSLESAIWVIACFMGMGAVFGVMNTMFAAISQRIKDIAVLRLMGFLARDILIAFLLEAVFVSILGGALGVLLGFSFNGLSSRFSVGSHDVEFVFRVNGEIVLVAVAFSIVMGVLGGLVPAMTAMRVRPLEAFR